MGFLSKKTRKSAASKTRTETKLPASPEKQQRISDRIAMMEIPENEMTEAVHLAITALMEKLDDTTYELAHTKEALAEMERLVDVDCVVPIANRRAFMRRLTWAINMHDRYGHPTTILYFDVNRFKSINDQYGHAAGDAAIYHVSQLLLTAARESDFVARIGGDEFAIIMYYANEESARKRGARIAEKLAETPFTFAGRSLTVTTAIGCYSIGTGDDAESALAAADTSMYIDKRRSKAAQQAEV